MTRDDRLEACGRKLARWGAAVAWTMGNTGDNAKRCGQGWDRERRLGDAEFAAGLFRTRGQTRNPCVVLRASGLLGIEVDTPDDLRAYGELGLPRTATARSSEPHRKHFYFRPPEGAFPSHFGFRFESGRVFADTGRYFVAPPSLHPTGVEYAWENDDDPTELTPEQFETLMAVARQSVESQRRVLSTSSGKVSQGNRRQALVSLVRANAFRGMPHDAILDFAQVWNEAVCDPPLDRRVVEQHTTSVLNRYGHQQGEEIGAPSPEDYRPDFTVLADALRRAQSVPDDIGVCFPSPDFIIKRLVPGRLTILGGYSGDGKTTCALHFVLSNIEQDPNFRVAFFTLEMSDTDLAMRMAQVMVGRDEWRNVDPDTLSGHAVNIFESEDNMEEMIRRNGPYDLVVVDHLHHMAFNDRLSLEQKARNFKRLAKVYRAPILLLAQLATNREFPRPQPNSFRESGMIQAVADLETYVWRERNEQKQRTELAELVVGKDRYGKSDYTELMRWDEERTCLVPRRDIVVPHVVVNDLAPFEDGGDWDETLEALGL